MILALKTAGPTTQAWLFTTSPSPDVPIAHFEWESGRELSEQLLGRLSQFVGAQHQQLKDLTAILIFSGPGSFTSLRIGHATANALADSLGIPIVGAQGDNWLATAREQLTTAKIGRPALPHYGAEANITKPKS